MHHTDAMESERGSTPGAWNDLERLVVAAAIGELDFDTAIAEICRTVTTSWGPTCRFVMGRGGEPGPDERLIVVAKHDERAGALFIGLAPELEPVTIDRLTRLVQLLLEAVDPFPMLHQIRNRLSGVLLNVEFVEMIINEAPEFGEDRIGREQRTQLLTAIRHARRTSSEIVELVREPNPVAPTKPI
jgi:hypothetical protein